MNDRIVENRCKNPESHLAQPRENAVASPADSHMEFAELLSEFSDVAGGRAADHHRDRGDEQRAGKSAYAAVSRRHYHR